MFIMNITKIAIKTFIKIRTRYAIIKITKKDFRLF